MLVERIPTCHFCVRAVLRFIFIYIYCVCELHHVHSQIVEKLMAVDSLADIIIFESLSFP